MKQTGFYCIKDKFFDDMGEPFLKNNKAERRPHYYCFRDEQNGLCWMIPLSGRVAKYRRLIAERESVSKPCDILHILTLDNGRDSVFLIQDMFPVTDEYISREFTINGAPLRLTSEKAAGIIERKARKVMKLLMHGVKFTPTQPDIAGILKKLAIKNKEASEN